MTYRLPLLLTICALFPGCMPEASRDGGTCIAPANPGGGWDLTCRASVDVLANQTPSIRPMRVVNVPGEGGGIAFKRVVEHTSGGDRVLVAASPSTLLGLAQQHYGAYTERNVRWIAAVGAEPSVIAVGADAPWRTLGELVTAWRADPGAIVIGGGSVVGGQDHMKILLLARAAGVDVRRVTYVPLSGPVEAITSLQRGTIHVFPGDASEVRKQVSARTLRVLAVLGDRRSPGVLAGVPTAREQGLDVTWIVWRGFYAPPGTSDTAYQQWVVRLHTMSETPEWKALLARNALTPFFMGGSEFETFVTAQTAAYRTVSREIGLIP